MTTRAATTEGCTEQRQEGQFEAKMFFQSLLDHTEAMNKDIAGSAFAEAVFDEFLLYKRSESAVHGLGRLTGFLSCIGEILWEVAEEKRAMIELVESEVTAEKERHMAKACGSANVIRFVVNDARD